MNFRSEAQLFEQMVQLDLIALRRRASGHASLPINRRSALMDDCCAIDSIEP
jgi:hypothetical protein